MRKFLLGLLVLMVVASPALAVNPPANFFVGPADSADPCSGWGTAKTTSNSAAITTATTTALITNASGTALIYICGLYYGTTAANSANTLQFEYGTGATCGTGTTTVTQAFVPATAQGAAYISVLPGYGGTSLKIPAGNNFCVVTAGTTTAISVFTIFVNQ